MNIAIILRKKKLLMKHVNFEKSKNVLEKANKSDLITIFTQKIR